MNKYNPEKYFEDFENNATFQHALPRTLTEGDNALYLALTGERYPIFCSQPFAQKLGFRRELINDLLVFNTVFGKSVSDISKSATASLGYADVYFLEPVYPGDTISAESTVIGKIEELNNKSGTVYVQTKGFNQHGKTVLKLNRWIKINKRDPDVFLDLNEEPEFPESINLDSYTIPEFIKKEGVDPCVTGGSYFFEDYEIGERIHHIDGRTIEESGHMLATSSYQNTTRVHFNGHFMSKARSGKRIIYGGHIISIARALSFNGLENALGMIGWNRATHINSTFGGDTLYAWTDILDKKELPGTKDFGALRLRLVAVKNMSPLDKENETGEEMQLKFIDPETEKEQYHPNIVLSLDYYVLMPKK